MLLLEYSFVCAENLTLRKVDQKYLESFKMWCCRRTEEIIWADRVKNEEMLHRVKEERNTLSRIKRRNRNWICHILLKKYLLKRVIERKIEGKIEVTGRQLRRRQQLPDDLKTTRGHWKLKEETLCRTLWKTHFGRGYGPVLRWTVK